MTDTTRFVAALLAGDAYALTNGLAPGAWLDVLVPEIRVEMDFVQRTRYHAYTNLEHSLRTCAALPPDLVLRTTGLFHDIGKRRTTTIKERNGEEQYLGHATVGALMTEGILRRLRFEEPVTREVCRLIHHHMDLHSASLNGQSARAQSKLLGHIEDDLPKLELIQIADIRAMAPELASEMEARAVTYHALLARTIADRDHR